MTMEPIGGRNPDDAHQHFWNPARGDYGWMPADDPVLSRPYNPADLTDGLIKTGIRKTILVQAAPTVSETAYLLGIADATPHVAAVVGWIDFECADQIDTLRRLAAHPKFVGVRPMIQDIADVNWMLRDDMQWAFQAVVDLDLTFDALGFPQHAENCYTILRRYPQMRAIIDHCLKPQIRDHSKGNFEAWAADIARIAEGTKAYCKLSGLATEANPEWMVNDPRPYIDHVIAVFNAAPYAGGVLAKSSAEMPKVTYQDATEEDLETVRQVEALCVRHELAPGAALFH